MADLAEDADDEEETTMTLDPDTPWWARLILSRAIFPLLMIAGALVWALISPIIQTVRVRRLRREQGLAVQDDKDGPTGIRLQEEANR